MTTPDIDNVINSAIEADSTLKPESVETDTQEVDTKVETPVEAEQEESFTTFDPKTAPPELLGVYKKWQQDYTQKRQTEKAYIKDLESKLSQFEQRTNQPQVKNDIEESFNQGKQAGEINPNMSLADYTKYVINQAKKEIATENENSYIESNEKSFFNIDSRLDPNSPDHDEILLSFVAGKLTDLREEYEAQHNGSVLGFDFVSNGKSLIEKYEEKMAGAKKAFLEKQSLQAKSNSSKFAKQNPTAKSSSAKPSGKMSIDEAFDKAVEETGADF